MKKILTIFTLFLLCMSLVSQAYVMSETLVEFAKRNNPDVLILGDAHIPSEIGRHHFNAIKADLLERSKKDARVYVSLEDRPWEHKDTYTTSTLNDLIVFAREHNNRLGSITFGSSDWRTDALLWPLFFCGEYRESCYMPEADGNEKFNKVYSLLYSIYGDAIPTGNQVVREANKFLIQIKKKAEHNSDVDLSRFMAILEHSIKRLTAVFKSNKQERVIDTFSRWNRQDPSGKLFRDLYSPLQAFTNAVADAGFLIDFSEKKDQFDQVIFYLGHFHALAIGDTLKQINPSTEVRVRSKGPKHVPSGDLHALPEKEIQTYLKALSCEPRIKKGIVKNMAFDFITFLMMALVGLIILVQVPRKARAK